MDPVLYTSLSSATIDFSREGISANNLANVNTPGFKADLFAAQTMYMPNGGEGYNDVMQAMAVQMPNRIDLTPGPLMTTSRDLDLAVDGDGWFAVQSGNGEAYTRAGNFIIDSNGMLTTAAGQPVLGDGGPISIPPAQRIDIGRDGTISIIPLDAKPNEVAVLDRIKLVQLDGKQAYKDENGLIRLQGGAKAVPSTEIKLVQGALEGSNVSAIDQMINLISTGREFDASLKLMQAVDENTAKLAQVLHE